MTIYGLINRFWPELISSSGQIQFRCIPRCHYLPNMWKVLELTRPKNWWKRTMTSHKCWTVTRAILNSHFPLAKHTMTWGFSELDDDGTIMVVWGVAWSSITCTLLTKLEAFAVVYQHVTRYPVDACFQKRLHERVVIIPQCTLLFCSRQ